MTAEISIGDIPIPTETQDPIMKEVFQLEDQNIIGDKPNKANIEMENKTSTPVKMKQVKIKCVISIYSLESL